LDYFAAVQAGRARVSKAVAVLQGVAGPSYPMLFLKLGLTNWTPVGEEQFQKMIPGKNGTAALIICDGEGNSKAMSAWVPSSKAEEFSRSLESMGIMAFAGDVKLPI